ncbi:hypothetical protein [Nitrosomonas sp. wSCUT-2]
MKQNLLTLLVVLVFLSACSSLQEAAHGNIRSGKSKVYWIDPVTRQPGGYVYWIDPASGKPGGNIVSRTVSQ